jgi:hypothetical protein
MQKFKFVVGMVVAVLASVSEVQPAKADWQPDWLSPNQQPSSQPAPQQEWAKWEDNIFNPSYRQPAPSPSFVDPFFGTPKVEANEVTDFFGNSFKKTNNACGGFIQGIFCTEVVDRIAVPTFKVFVDPYFNPPTPPNSPFTTQSGSSSDYQSSPSFFDSDPKGFTTRTGGSCVRNFLGFCE